VCEKLGLTRSSSQSPRPRRVPQEVDGAEKYAEGTKGADLAQLRFSLGEGTWAPIYGEGADKQIRWDMNEVAARGAGLAS
jgi:hypothetical protein